MASRASSLGISASDDVPDAPDFFTSVATVDSKGVEKSIEVDLAKISLGAVKKPERGMFGQKEVSVRLNLRIWGERSFEMQEQIHRFSLTLHSTVLG